MKIKEMLQELINEVKKTNQLLEPKPIELLAEVEKVDYVCPYAERNSSDIS